MRGGIDTSRQAADYDDPALRQPPAQVCRRFDCDRLPGARADDGHGPVLCEALETAAIPEAGRHVG